MTSQQKTEDLKEDEDEEEDKKSDLSASSSSETDSEDELARSRVPDDDHRWQKVTYDNGVKKIVLRQGWGKPAPDGSDAYVGYIGKFKDSQRVFEDNTQLKPPFKFLVGHFRVIRAIDIAVAAMKIGEKCLLRSSSRYAYGEKGEGRKIAPNKDLDYELEVVDWNDWKRVNNKDEVRKRVLKQGEGDMYDVPDASAICDITYTAQIFDDEKYPSNVFSCGRHIDFMVNEDPTLPQGFHEALKSMNKYEIAEFKISGGTSYSLSSRYNNELGVTHDSTIYYRIQMHNYQNLMSRWKMEPRQLFDVGNRFKVRAGEYFGLGNWDYAFNRYEKALEYFEADEKMDGEEKHEAAQYITMVHNNMAMIHLKRNEFLDCIRECNKVLKHDTNNVKAWCRRGQSKMMLAEYKKANKDLRHALSLDVNNKYIKKLIKINKNKKKSYNANQKELYGGMFDRYNQAMKDRKAAKEQEKQSQEEKNADVQPYGLRSVEDINLNYGDIDDYDNEDNESEMSIDFDFDDMDDGDKADDDADSDDSSDDDDDEYYNNNKDKDNINSLEAIDED